MIVEGLFSPWRSLSIFLAVINALLRDKDFDITK